MNNLELLIGLISIALALFFGIFFGLRGFRKSVTGELSPIKEAVIAIRTTVEKTWDLILRQFAPSSGTIERELKNLGKIRITAEPGENETSYLIEIQAPILVQGLLQKLDKETGVSKKEKQMFGREGHGIVLSRNRVRLYIPCTEPKLCTEYITFFLRWLNSTYFESLKGIKDFEEPILS